MYCNYSKDKFDNELTFIQPAWNISLELNEYDEGKSLLFYLCKSEKLYNHLVNNCNWKAQQARMILPLCLKTEICMTGFESDWRHFFDLRYYGETGKPHPDMELLASKARDKFMEAGLWDSLMQFKSRFDKDQ